MPLETTRHPYYSSMTLDRRLPSHGRWRESNSSSSGSSNLYISSHALSGLDTSSTYAPSPLSSMSLYLPPRANTSASSYSQRPRPSEYSYANRSGSSHLSPAMSKRNALIGNLTRTSNDLTTQHFLSQDAVSLMTSTESYLPSSIRSTFTHSAPRQSRTYSRAITTDLGTSLLPNSSACYNSNATNFNNRGTTFRNAYRPIVIERPSITNFVPRPREERMRLPTRVIRRDRPLIKFLEREDLNPAKVRNLLSAWARGENLDEDYDEKCAHHKKDSVRSNDSGIGSVRGSRRSRQKSGDFGMEIDEHEIQVLKHQPGANSPGLDEGVHLETEDGMHVLASTVKYQRELEKDIEHDKKVLTCHSLKKHELREQSLLDENIFSKRRVRIRDQKQVISYEDKENFKDENNNIAPSVKHDSICKISKCADDSDNESVLKHASLYDVSIEKSKRTESECIQYVGTGSEVRTNNIQEQFVKLESELVEPIQEKNKNEVSTIKLESIKKATDFSDSNEISKASDDIHKSPLLQSDKSKRNSISKIDDESQQNTKSKNSHTSEDVKNEKKSFISSEQFPTDKRPKEDTEDRPPKETTADKPPKEDTADKPPKEDTANKTPKEDTADKPPKEDTADKSPKQITTNKLPKQITTNKLPNKITVDKPQKKPTNDRPRKEIFVDVTRKQIAEGRILKQISTTDNNIKGVFTDDMQNQVTTDDPARIITGDGDKSKVSTEKPPKPISKDKITEEKKQLIHNHIEAKEKKVKTDSNTKCEDSEGMKLDVHVHDDKEKGLKNSKTRNTLQVDESSVSSKNVAQKIKTNLLIPLKAHATNSTNIIDSQAIKTTVLTAKNDSNTSERNIIIEYGSNACTKSKIKCDKLTEAPIHNLNDVKCKEKKMGPNTCKPSVSEEQALKETNSKKKWIETSDKLKDCKKEGEKVQIDLSKTAETKKSIEEKLDSLKATKIIKIEISKKCENSKQDSTTNSYNLNRASIESKEKETTKIFDKDKGTLYVRTPMKSSSSGAILSSTSGPPDNSSTTCSKILNTKGKSENHGRIEKSLSENLTSRHKITNSEVIKAKNECEQKDKIKEKNNTGIKEDKTEINLKGAPEASNDMKRANDIRRSTTTSFDVSQLEKGLPMLQKSFTTECYNTVKKHKTDNFASNKMIMKKDKQNPVTKLTETSKLQDDTGLRSKSSDMSNITHNVVNVTEEKLYNAAEHLEKKLNNHNKSIVDATKTSVNDAKVTAKPSDQLIKSDQDKEVKKVTINSKDSTLRLKQTTRKNDIPITSIGIGDIKEDTASVLLEATDLKNITKQPQKTKKIEIPNEKTFIKETEQNGKLLVQRSISNSEVTTMQTSDKKEKFLKENTSTLKRVNSVRSVQGNTEYRIATDILESAEKLQTNEIGGCQTKDDGFQKRKILKYVGVNKLKVQEESEIGSKSISKPKDETDNLRKEVKLNESAITSKKNYSEKRNLLESPKISDHLKETVAGNEPIKPKVDRNVVLSAIASQKKGDHTINSDKLEPTPIQPVESRERSNRKENNLFSVGAEIEIKNELIASVLPLKNICLQSYEKQIRSNGKCSKYTNRFGSENRKSDAAIDEQLDHHAQSIEQQENITKQKIENANAESKKPDRLSNQMQTVESNSKKCDQVTNRSITCDVTLVEKSHKVDHEETIPDSHAGTGNKETISSQQLSSSDSALISAEEKLTMGKKKKPKTEGNEEKVKKKKKKKEIKTEKGEEDSSCIKIGVQIDVDRTENDHRSADTDAKTSDVKLSNITEVSRVGSCKITEKKETPAVSDATSVGLDDLWYDYNDLTTECPKTLTTDLKQTSLRRRITIEKFNFLKVLGRGSYGKVMLAELKGRNQFFAIKCLKKDVVLEDNDVECTMIEREVLAMGSSHPYLCTLYWTFQNESHLFFVMEYLSGGDLMFHIQQSGRFEQERARFYAAEIVCALKYLHKHGIIYRDAKLDNICIDSDGHIRLVDFGFCKLRIYRKECLPRNLCGTPDYMAPEIIKGHHYNQSVDWWSFGVLLYEMLIGQSPFNGTDEEELFWSVCNEEVFYPRFLTVEAKQLLSLLFDKDPEKRLGMPGCHTGDIYYQPFFHCIDWKKVEQKELEPPFKPKLKSKTDVSNFDSDFTMETAVLTPTDADILRSLEQQQFAGFTFTNPNMFI